MQSIAVLDLLTLRGSPLHRRYAADEPSGHAQRLRALLRCKCLACGPVRGQTELRHYCPAGCHRDEASVRAYFQAAISELWLAHPPAIPEWNKFNKIMPAVTWFASFVGWAGMLPEMCHSLCELVQENEVEGADGAAAVGMMSDQQAFHLQELARFKKTSNWLAAPTTGPKLIAITLALKFIVHLLGDFFQASRMFDEREEAQSVLPLLRASSPAQAAIRSYLRMLGDAGNEFWRPLACGAEWSATTYRLASVPIWTILSHMYKRFVLTFQEWSWLLAGLVDDVEDAHGLGVQQALAATFWRAQECCLDPVSRWLRGHVRSEADVLAPEFRHLLRRIFEATPASNVRSENRFSRQSRHGVTSQGNPAELSSLAAAHTLAETKSQLEAHMWTMP